MLGLFIIRFEIAFIITDQSLNKLNIMILIFILFFIVILWTSFEIMVLVLRTHIMHITSRIGRTKDRIIIRVVLLISILIVVVLRDLQLVLRSIKASD
jgi:hypothetical protein